MTPELPWKTRVEEPTNRFLYYPIARPLARLLAHTPISANQVTMVQPMLAALAGWLITFEDPRYLIAGALVFELRSLLDCVDGTLARLKNTASPSGHAMDAICDWLGVVFLYAGVYWHFRLHAPPAGTWSAYLPMAAVIGLSLFQGAVRSFAADYYMRKFFSILERGRDETVEDLREKQRVLSASSPFWFKVECWIGRCQHLSLQHEHFDVKRTESLGPQQIQAFRDRAHAPFMRRIAWLWSLSNGDAFIRLTVLSLLLGHRAVWELQLFFASVGYLWIFGLIALTSWAFRRIVDGAPERVEA